MLPESANSPVINRICVESNIRYPARTATTARKFVATDLFIESVLKPDPALRQCAHNQKCYHELMDVRQDVLDYLNSLRWH